MLKQRRYVDGRLVRERCLRRTTLQNARDLGLEPLPAHTRAKDRYESMLDWLRDAADRAAGTVNLRDVGHTRTEPDRQSTGDARRDAGLDADGQGGQSRELAASNPNTEGTHHVY